MEYTTQRNTSNTPSSNHGSLSAHSRGETMAYALQSCAYNLGAQFVFPKQMKSVDSWLSERVFAPMMQDKSTAVACESYEYVGRIRGHSPESSTSYSSH